MTLPARLSPSGQYPASAGACLQPCGTLVAFRRVFPRVGAPFLPPAYAPREESLALAQQRCEVDQLIAAAKANPAQLGKLLERYRSALLFIGRGQLGRRISSRCSTSDVVQQTLAEAGQCFPEFRGTTEAEFSAWIKRIHGHNLNDALRQNLAGIRDVRREVSLPGPDDTVSFCWHEPAAGQSTPSEAVVRGEQALRLAEIIESLPELQREAVRLRHVEGWPVERIARDLDRSVAATAGLIKRGLQKLREKMSEESWR